MLMRQLSETVAARARWALVVLPAVLFLVQPATSYAKGYVDQEEMRTSTHGRWTFVYDPGVGNTIPRQQFTEPLLSSYYEARGFDANFVDWAPTETFDPGAASWASCKVESHPEPCPVGDFGFDPVRVGVEHGDITALRWNGAFIGTYCGNFTESGGSGPAPEITGVKYEDRNADGVREEGEPGLPGWTINLLYEGKVVASTTTDAEGRYRFKLDADHMPIGPGTYQVQEVNKAGWVQSQAPGTITVGAGVGEAHYGGNDFGNFDPKITATGQNLTGTEGAEVGATVATFTDPDPLAAANEYSATIKWGDGSESTGTVSGSGGEFSVSGSHTYAEEGSYPITVQISDVDNSSNTATATSSATIGDAELSSACATPTATLQAFAGSTATFKDANPGGTSSDFSATIAWGDGSESAGVVSAGAGHGPYTVSGAHAYSFTGPVTITTTITDVGGSKTVVRCSTIVFVFPTGGGAFVIGDENSSNETPVTFWGSQWWKKNSLSGNIAGGQKVPAGFKGFAEEPATPSCGVSWSADPGNSSPPPAGPLPAYMGVIVTSTAGRTGATITGDTVHIVVIKTKPGYQPNPGHPGTGTVVAQVC
jgi:hypothetical protein